MLSGVEDALLEFVSDTYNAIGWPGVIFLMALESIVFPLPSEIVMPLAGWKLIEEKGRGWEWLFLAGFFGAIGTTIGAWFAYYVGMWGGRRVIEKYGKWLLISKKDLDVADRFFARWGNWAVLFGRLIPLVRSFISVPAGIARMPIVPFTAYSFIGSFVWSIGLAYGGYKLGENYEDIREWMQPLEYPIAALLALLVIWYVVRHVREVFGQDAAAASEGGRAE